MFQEENLTYEQATDIVSRGEASARRIEWGKCKFIRPYMDSDGDYIQLAKTDGVIMEECDQKVCDCRIGIYRPEDEDKAATDWQIFPKDE